MLRQIISRLLSLLSAPSLRLQSVPFENVSNIGDISLICMPAMPQRTRRTKVKNKQTNKHKLIALHGLIFKIKAAARVMFFICRYQNRKSRCASNCLVLVALLQRVTRTVWIAKASQTITPDSTRIEINP